MESELRLRLTVLIGLATVGVTLAGIGAALGVSSSLTNQEDTPGFVINEDNITFSSSGDEVTIVENMSDVNRVSIDTVESNQFRVHTETGKSLTAAERKHAREIARNNETVKRYLDSVDEYTLKVKPVYKIDADSLSTTSIDLTNSSSNGKYTVINTSEDDSNSTIIIGEDSNVIEGRAVVHVQQPSEPQQDAVGHTIDVDLVNESVTEFENPLGNATRV